VKSRASSKKEEKVLKKSPRKMPLGKGGFKQGVGGSWSVRASLEVKKRLKRPE